MEGRVSGGPRGKNKLPILEWLNKIQQVISATNWKLEKGNAIKSTYLENE